jgi:hypothetical protein
MIGIPNRSLFEATSLFFRANRTRLTRAHSRAFSDHHASRLLICSGNSSYIVLLTSMIKRTERSRPLVRPHCVWLRHSPLCDLQWRRLCQRSWPCSYGWWRCRCFFWCYPGDHSSCRPRHVRRASCRSYRRRSPLPRSRELKFEWSWRLLPRRHVRSAQIP